MMKETKIEEMFARYQPDLGDNDAYMEKISKKLEAVEYIKRFHEEQAARSRRMMVTMFVSGIVTGAFSIILLLLFPQWLEPIIGWFATLSPNLPPMLPKMLFLLTLCLISLSITKLAGELSLKPHQRKSSLR